MKLLVLPGDGIGPEITAATLAVLDAADRRFRLGLSCEKRDIGFASLKTERTTLPDGILARAREVDGVILGPISHLDYPPAHEGGIKTRRACVRNDWQPLAPTATRDALRVCRYPPTGTRRDGQSSYRARYCSLRCVPRSGRAGDRELPGVDQPSRIRRMDEDHQRPRAHHAGPRLREWEMTQDGKCARQHFSHRECGKPQAEVEIVGHGYFSLEV